MMTEKTKTASTMKTVKDDEKFAREAVTDFHRVREEDAEGDGTVVMLPLLHHHCWSHCHYGFHTIFSRHL